MGASVDVLCKAEFLLETIRRHRRLTKLAQFFGCMGKTAHLGENILMSLELILSLKDLTWTAELVVLLK